MRTIVYIGRAGCTSCTRLRLESIEPLKELYPENVEVHSGYDSKIAEVDARQTIDKIPLIVVEKDGVEEFRYHGWMSLKDLEDIILCGKEDLTLEEVFK